MQTVHINEHEFIKYDGRIYRMSEESSDAAVSAESAQRILGRENILLPNGLMSHEAANEALEKAEDILLGYLCVTTA